MKTIVYLEDGSIEATTRADAHVASGIARFATPSEVASYERAFQQADDRAELIRANLDACVDIDEERMLPSRWRRCG